MVKLVVAVLFILTGCASDNYSRCVAQPNGQDCGVWVVETPKHPEQQVVRSGDRLFIETVRY